MRRYKRKSVEVGVSRRGGSLWARISEGRERRPPTNVGVRVAEWLPFRVVSKYPQCIVWFCHKGGVSQTDGRTDGQNYDFQDRASIAASRGKNGTLIALSTHWQGFKRRVMNAVKLLDFWRLRVYDCALRARTRQFRNQTLHWQNALKRLTTEINRHKNERHKPAIRQCRCRFNCTVLRVSRSS